MTQDLNHALQEVQGFSEGSTMQMFAKMAQHESYCNLRNAMKRQEISVECAFKMVRALDGNHLHFDNMNDYMSLLMLLLTVMEEGLDCEFMAQG